MKTDRQIKENQDNGMMSWFSAAGKTPGFAFYAQNRDRLSFPVFRLPS